MQTDLDMNHRQINWDNNLNSYKRNNITIVRYPIRDFDQDDLTNKLRKASELLKNLIKQGKAVYVHCTAGMSRAAATVILYLVLNHEMTLEDAYDYVKSYREIICPNIKAIAKVIENESLIY